MDQNQALENQSAEFQTVKGKSTCLGILVLTGILIWSVFAFGNEIKLVLQTILSWITRLFGLSFVPQPPIDEIAGVLLLPCLYSVSLAAIFFLFLGVVSQFVLPVRAISERVQSFERVLLKVFHRHGPVLFAKEGRLAGAPVEAPNWPGIVRVDTDSAVVFEKPWYPNALLRFVYRARKPRIRGQSQIFTGWYEKVRGIVSLRKQFRMSKQGEVKGYTRDGIEVKTAVFVIFTLSQSPRVIKVTSVGPNADDLRVLQVDEDTGAIKAIVDELDPEDKAEIYRFARDFRSTPTQSAQLVPEDRPREYPPFHLDKKRIFAAVFSEALDASSHKLIEWTDLPIHVATEVFRNMVSKVAYDNLFLPENLQITPPQIGFRPSFSRFVRNLGVLSFQYVQPRDGSLPQVGQELSRRKFFISPVQELHTPKVLRDRGIKIIYAGFSELEPDENVRRQSLDHWHARWQKKVDGTRAGYDREIILIRNRARAEAQREMIFSLSEIFRTTPHMQEALILELFQALDKAAADPATRQLLPHDTINILRSLRSWLVAGEDRVTALFDENLPDL